MRRTFIESSAFTKKIDREGQEALLLIQGELLERLELSPIIQGTGGLRKLRIPNTGRSKGKRGGYRVIYLDLPAVARTYLLAIYSKNEKGDISADEKRLLRILVERIKKEAR